MRHLIGFGLPIVMMLAGMSTVAFITGRTETAAIIVFAVVALVYLAIGALAYRMGLRFGSKARGSKGRESPRG